MVRTVTAPLSPTSSKGDLNAHPMRVNVNAAAAMGPRTCAQVFLAMRVEALAASAADLAQASTSGRYEALAASCMRRMSVRAVPRRVASSLFTTAFQTLRAY